jgi:hypothetical protein
MTWQQLWCWMGWHDFDNNLGTVTIVIIDGVERMDKHYAICNNCRKKFEMITLFHAVEVSNDVDRKS